MEESKTDSDIYKEFALRIQKLLSPDPNSPLTISKEKAISIIYPPLAKLKTEVRLRK